MVLGEFDGICSVHVGSVMLYFLLRSSDSDLLQSRLPNSNLRTGMLWVRAVLGEFIFVKNKSLKISKL